MWCARASGPTDRRSAAGRRRLASESQRPRRPPGPLQHLVRRHPTRGSNTAKYSIGPSDGDRNIAIAPNRCTTKATKLSTSAGDALIPGSTDTRKAVTAYRSRTAAAHLSPLKVKREEGQDGHPNLVPLRGHVQPNEGCTPRELNAFKPHRCCPVLTLRAVWQVAADSFTTGGNASLAQAQATTDERRCRCRSASSRTACPLW